MSKNSAQQTYEASKAFAQMVENKRKRNETKVKIKPKFKKYHPALEHDED